MTAPTAEELNTVGINRIIESAERIAKGKDKAARTQIRDAAAAVIEECEMEEGVKRSALLRLMEALKI